MTGDGLYDNSCKQRLLGEIADFRVRHAGKDQVLPGREPNLATAVAVGEVGDAAHLPGRDPPDRDAEADEIQTRPASGGRCRRDRCASSSADRCRPSAAGGRGGAPARAEPSDRRDPRSGTPAATECASRASRDRER